MNTGKRSPKLVVFALSIVVFFAFTCMPACAERAYQIVPDGRVYSLAIGPEVLSEPQLSLFFVSEGNETTAVSVVVKGPEGLHGEVDGVQIAWGERPSIGAFADTRRRESFKIWHELNGNRFDGFVVNNKSSDGSVKFLYHLHKDACIRAASTRYISRLLLDFSGVDREILAQGVLVQVALQEYRYQGSKAATIKPAAHGKYLGEPIVLMETLQFGGESVRIIQRSSHKVHLRQEIPVVKYVSYRGRVLSLARLRGILRGGKATFELSNGGAVYAVCFNLVRRRQVANGYPLR